MMDIPDVHLRVVYDFEYDTKDKRKIQIVRGEKLFLLNKTNADWWQVIRNSSERPFYVPASYVTEINKSKSVPKDRKRHSYTENTPQYLPVNCNSISKRCISPESVLKEGKYNFDWTLGDSFLVNGSDFDAKVVTSHSVSDSDDVSSVLYHEGYRDKYYDKFRSEEFDTSSEENVICCDHEILKRDSSPFMVNRNKTPELLSEKCSASEYADVGISSICEFEEIKDLDANQSESNVEREKTKTPSSSLEKLLQKFKSISAYKHKDIESSQCDPLASEIQGDKEMRTYPRGANVAGRNKLSYSRSFESGRDVGLKNFSLRKPRISHLSSSWEAQSRESTESLDECLHEDGVSDSGASFRSSELLSGHDTTDYDPRNTIHEDVICSSCDDVDSVPLPAGWRKSYDEVSGEQCYISEVSQARWFSSTDHEGRVYFFEENSVESSWTLPKVSVDDSEVSVKKSALDVPVDPLLRVKEGEKRSTSRITKARSLLVTDKKQRESSNRSSSIPRNFLLDQSGVLKEGPLNRTKITENGKKVRKNWAVGHVVLREQFLVFYKDSKSVQPELVMELSEVVLESGDKMSKRKNVFLVSTAGLQVLCQAEDTQLACDWCSAIKQALESLDKNSTKLLTPHSPGEENRCSSLVRSRSLRSKNHEGSTEDQLSSYEEQTKIRNRLKRFFHRRPTRETLARKGIYKDEPVFDNHLEKVCPLEHPRIPKFVQLCINAIEGKEENMKTDGLYRASGNLSHVQKIRLEVDQNNLQVLEREEDVHVLTGALKLFFRELKEPLIPFELFTTALETVNSDKKKKIRMFQDIVQQLPDPNRDTLAFLLRHLRKVTEYEEHNRMHIPNLAIVFGPTLIWREKECHQNMALEYMQQNLVIEFFLLQFDEIFKNFKLPHS
ncbi:rho GTPase-activating protein 12 isoform X2 [Anabrus simplex]|uniref:rho GTPase-activating protein 12 isoform X2 n=1 Tax=Anabrus simplex TaxID=316456 RepID=UPI0035A34610